MASIAKILAAPKKSTNDLKNYRLIQLKNGIKVLLVDDSRQKSQTSTVMAACALSVNVGSFSDPTNAKGLAHLIEHLISMGCEKYPTENELKKVVDSNAGSSNAETGYEDTIHYFSIAAHSFEHALDIFSSSFTKPLMRMDSMVRERIVVDEEYHQQTSIFSMNHLLSSLATDGHPSGTFTCGNLTTLKENITDANLHAEILKFLNNYSAHRMNVVLQAPTCLDNLQTLAEKYFSAIPRKRKRKDDFQAFNEQNAFTSSFSKVYFLNVAGVDKLHLTWAVPSKLYTYKSNPFAYVTYVLHRKEVGSLYWHLARGGLATNVSASFSDRNSVFAVFTVSVELTKRGLTCIELILRTISNYLQTIRADRVNQHFIKNLQLLGDIQFQSKTKDSKYESVQELSRNMLYRDQEDILGHGDLSSMTEHEVKSVIALLCIGNFNTLLESNTKVSGVWYDQKMRWHNKYYGCVDFPQAWTTAWTARGEHLPINSLSVLQNDFLPRQKMDFSQGNAHFCIYSNLPQSNIRSMVSLQLMEHVLQDFVRVKLWQALEVGFVITIMSNTMGLILEVTGFSETISLVTAACANVFRSFIHEMDQEMFHEEKVKRLWCYSSSLSSHRFSRELLRHKIDSGYSMTIERGCALYVLNFEEFKEFSLEYFSTLDIQMQISSNVSLGMAQKMASDFMAIIGCTPCKAEQQMRLNRLRPLTINRLRVKSLWEAKNSTVSNYYEFDHLNSEQARGLRHFVHNLNGCLFEKLRTKETLAYNLNAFEVYHGGIDGYVIEVNSTENRNTAADVNMKIENFRKEFIGESVEFHELLRKEYAMLSIQVIGSEVEYAELSDEEREINKLVLVFDSIFKGYCHESKVLPF